ncbi:MAG: hypothetical protein HYW28_02605 [Rhodospirillales bacterium]|nr:hypothetical protein [Rhodospirillales bacterium]
MITAAFAIIAGALIYGFWSPESADAKEAILYKNPQCDCCEGYAKYLRQNGFKVTVKATHDLSLIKREHGVSEAFEGCHTTLIDGYVVEGHVPLKTLNKLLAERPQIKGISLPGMPLGTPGMTGRKDGPFRIYEIKKGAPKVYAVE